MIKIHGEHAEMYTVADNIWISTNIPPALARNLHAPSDTIVIIHSDTLEIKANRIDVIMRFDFTVTNIQDAIDFTIEFSKQLLERAIEKYGDEVSRLESNITGYVCVIGKNKQTIETFKINEAYKFFL